MYNPGEIKGFCPKSCNLRAQALIQPFYERNATTGRDSPNDTVPGAPCLDDKTFWPSSCLFATSPSLII